MRLFPVPMDLTEEEKTVGGVLSIKQVVYLLSGGFLSVLALIILFALRVPFWLGALLSAPLFIFSLYVAFGRPADTPADLYLYLWYLYRKREKNYFLRGDS